MIQAFEHVFRIRYYECSADGTLSSAGHQHFFEQATIEASEQGGFDVAWYAAAQTIWIVRSMRISYYHPISAQESFKLSSWVSQLRHTSAQREFQMERVSDGRMIAQASANWVYIDRLQGRPVRIPAAIRDSYAIDQHKTLPAQQWPAPPPNARRWQWQHQVRSYELDPLEHVNNAVYLDWIAEAQHQISKPIIGLLDGQLRLEHQETHYLQAAVADDAIIVQSQLCVVNAAGLIWCCEIYRAEETSPLVRSYLAYRLVDRAGEAVELGAAEQAQLNSLLI